MPYTRAGRWTGVLETGGRMLLADTTFVVKNVGTSTLATVYTDRTKATTVTDSEVTSDDGGNLSIFADPGDYDLHYGASLLETVTVPLDPDKVAQIDQAQTITGVKTFSVPPVFDGYGTYRFGADGMTTAQTTVFDLGTPADVGTSYRMRHSVTAFTDSGGTYHDSLLTIGYNPDTRVAGEPQNTLNFEHKFRQSGTGPFMTETIFAWTSPDGTIGRRPFQFSVSYTDGAVNHTFVGKVSFFDSASTQQKIVLEDSATGPLRLARTTLSMTRGAADTARFFEALDNADATLAMLDYTGSLGLGGTADGAQYRLLLSGPSDLAKMAFANTTDSKTFQLGCLNSYTGAFVVDQVGVGNFLRVAHTTGRVQVGNITGDNWFTSATRLGVRISQTTEVGLALRAPAAYASDFFQALSDTQAVLSRVDKGGYFMTRKTAAPADGDLVAGEMALWFDATDAAAKLMVKAKEAGGTVRTGSLALA